MNPIANRVLFVLRRVAVATWPFAVVVMLGACQQVTVTERSPPVQPAPSDSGPAPDASERGATRLPDAPPPVPRPPSPSLPPPEAEPSPDVSPTEPPPSGVTLKPPPGVRDRTRVALLLPLSGRDAALGRAMLRAAELALFDIADDNMVLMPYDTAGKAGPARAAARAAIAHGARLVLGPLFSSSVRSVAPEVRDAGINLIAFSNNRDVAGASTFVLGFLPREQVSRVVSYARSRGHRRFAALVPDSPYGRAVADDLRAVTQAVGAVLGHVEFFSDDGADLNAAVRRLARYDSRRGALLARRKALEQGSDRTSARRLSRLDGVDTVGEVGFDALLIPVGGARLKEIAALLPFYDIDTSKIRLLGVSSWLAPGLGREPPLVGAWFAAPQTEAGAEFERRYQALFGAPPHELAPLAYDATALAAVLARQGAGFGAQALMSPNGFAGTAGIFRLLPSGEVQRGLAVLEVEPWRFRVVSPSPQTFEALTQ